MKLNFPLILLSVVGGSIGLSLSPRLSPLILTVPVLWALASTRLAAFAVMLAYNLAISRGLFHGAAVFLSESHTPVEAAILYFLMSFGASLPFGVFWAKDKKLKAACLVLAFLAAYVVPPISLIGIVNPLMATGTLFKGWGFAGIGVVLAIYAACAVFRKSAFVFLSVIVAFVVLPGGGWYTPATPNGIVAVDTSFGRLGSGSFDFVRDYERAEMVFADLRRRNIGKSENPYIVAGDDSR